MGWMGGGKAPKGPDYEELAIQSAKSEQEAATRADFANHANIYTPEGSQTWTPTQAIDPATGQTVTRWEQRVTLDPEIQKQVDAQQAQGVQRAAAGTGMLNTAIGAMSQPMDFSQFQDWNAGPQAGNLKAGNLSAGPNLTAGNLNANQYMTGGAGQGIMAGLNTRALGNMPQADAQERQRIENMMFDRMRPEHQQAQAGLEGQLANMGLTRGSEAWNREMQRLQRGQSDERYDAMMRGGEEMARQFGLQMQGRQQGWNEMLGAGQFQNQAQQQRFNQMLGQNQQNFGIQQQAGAQNFGQRQAAIESNFNRAQQAGAQNFSQQQQALNQNYNQGLQSAQLQNQLRGLQTNEAMLQRSLPMQEYLQMMGGIGGQGTPTFQQGPMTGAAGAVDYMGAGNSGYQAAMNSYNAGQAQQQGMMSGIVGLVGAGAMAM